MRTRFLLPLAAAALLIACDKTESATGPAAASASVTPTASVPVPETSASAAAAEETVAAPLELQELTFTTDVKNKEPVDTLVAAEAGKRVWAHLRLRNRGDQPRKIRLQFRVNDDKRTMIELQVEKSWSFRTWAYNTLLAGDTKGVVSLEVTDDTGAVLADTTVPIAGKVQTKPYVRKTP
jgi:hypothetical protein